MKCRRMLVWILAILLLGSISITAYAAGTNAQLHYVTDEAGLLTQEQKAELENRAAEISARYNLGVYIIVVENYRNYSNYSEIYDCCIDLYDRYQLGWGDDHAGTTLMLSMNGRDYALDFNSSRADYAFTESGRDQMENRFLSYFRSNDFYGGFREYLDCCEEYLEAAKSGNPVEYKTSKKDGLGIFSVIPGLIASLATGTAMAAPMRSAGTKHDANQYIVPGSLELRQQSDMFLHRTVSRRPRETNSGGSGSSHHSSGSHSGRSGKF